MIADGAALDLALHGEVSDPRIYLLRFYPDAPVPPLDQTSEGARPVEAEVNYGRWIWLCPCKLGGIDDPPQGGGVAFKDQPLGWCVRCENVEVGGLWRRLRFPDEADEIERVLMLRPDEVTRSWWPGETLADLERENREHGIGDA